MTEERNMALRSGCRNKPSFLPKSPSPECHGRQIAAPNARRAWRAQALALAAAAGLFYSQRSLVAATYYWDNNGSTTGFGTAGGSWAAPTIGNATQGWSTSATGGTVPGNITTATSDTINFGNGATGLAAGTITVSGNVSAGNITFASGDGAIVLSGGNITLGAADVITLNNAADTISSSLSGAGTSLTVAGVGTLTLSGASSYTGSTTITTGTLALGAGGSLGATAVTVDAGATFAVSQTGNGSANSVGNATFTLASGSQLSMADGYYSTLNLLGNATLAPAIGSGVVSPILSFDLIGNHTDVLAITRAATVGNATAQINIVPNATATAGTYTVITGGSGSNLNGNFSLVSSMLPAGNGLYTLSLGGNATAEQVTVAADGNASYWSGASNSTWSTAGNWNTGVANSIVGSAPSSSTDVVFSTTTPTPGNLTNTLGGNTTVHSVNFLSGAASVTVNADGNTLTINGGGINNGSANPQTINPSITLGGNQTWTNNGGLLTIGGNVGGSSYTITHAGTGTTLLSGTNSFGGLTVSSGTVQVGSSGGIPSGATLTVNGGTFDLNGNNVTAAYAAGTASGTITNNGNASTLTLTSVNAALNPALQDSSGALAVKLSGIAGTVTYGTNSIGNFNTANTFSGGLTLTNAAWLSLTSGNGLGTGPITIGTGPSDNASFMFYSGTATISNNFVVNSNIGSNAEKNSSNYSYAAAFTSYNGTPILSGNITVNAVANFTSYNASTYTLTGKVTGPGGISVAGQGNTSGGLSGSSSGWGSTLILDTAPGANDYSGNTTVDEGSNACYLKLGANDQIPNGAGKGNLIVNSGATFDLNGNHTDTINGLSGAGTVTNSQTGAAILTIGDGDTTSSFTGSITDSGSGKTLAITKIGNGTLTLSGSGNTYTGATTVSDGILLVSGGGTLSGTTDLTVQSGATFAYQPTTVGTTLTLGTGSTLHLNDGSIISLVAGNGTTVDNIKALGNATVGTGAGVGVTLSGFTSGDTYTILQAAGGLGNGSYHLIGNTNYKATFAMSPGNVTITPTSATALTGTAYWTGNSTVGIAGVWGASDGNSTSNWSASSGGAVQGLIPSGIALVFPASGVAVGATNTTLGGNMSASGLTINDATNGVSVNADGNTLSIGTGGITVASSVPTASFACNVALTGAQIWTNSSTATHLVVSGPISGGTNGLTIAGAGQTDLTGGGTIGLLTGNGTGAINLGAAGNDLTIGNGVSGNNVLTSTGNVTINSTGARLLIGGSGNEQLAVSSGTTLTINAVIANGSATFLSTYGSASSASAVVVLNGQNTMSTFAAGHGTVEIGANSQGAAGAPTSGPLGAGTVDFGAGSEQATITSSSTTGYTIYNNIAADTSATNPTLGNASNNGKLTFDGPFALSTANEVLTVNSPVEFDGGITNGGGSLTIQGATTTTTLGGSSANAVANLYVTSGSGTPTLAVSSTSASAVTTTAADSFSVAAGSTNQSGILYMAPGMSTTGQITANGPTEIGWSTGNQTVTGTIYQTAGNFSVASGQNLYLGLIQSVTGGTATGTWNIDGGTLSAAGPVYVAGNSNTTITGTVAGYLNVSGAGAVTATSTFEPEELGATNANTTSVINLNSFNGNSGMLTTPAWTASGHGTTAVLNFNGGTLVFGGNGSSNFLSAAVGSVNIYANGAIINTNGNSDTITQAINNPANNGVTSVAISGNSATYTSPPTVTFGGGTGTNATGYAQLNSSGQIDGIVVTNGGNFTGTETASISGSGLTLTVSQAANSGGGLTKIGSGVLTLSSSAGNNYAGGTNINAGTLLADNTTGSATGTGNVSVAATTTAGNSGNYTGGMLGGNGTISGAVTLAGNNTLVHGGIIAAGANSSTVGTLTTGNQTWNGGAAYEWKINAAGNATTLGNTTTVSGTAGTGYDFLKIGNATSGSLLSVLPSGNTAFTIDPIGNITVTTGATYNWTIAQIGSGNLTQITLNGNATPTSASTTRLNSSIFTLDTSSLTINGSNSSYLSNPSNFGVYFETLGVNNDLVLSYNSTPEPGTTILVLGGAVPMLMGRRRRKSKG